MNKLRITFFIVPLFLISATLLAQDYKPQKNSIGINVGTLSYSGRYSVGASLESFSHLYGSIAFRSRVMKQLYVRGELLGGHMRADNTKIESQFYKPNGSFETEIGELSVKAEYDFIDLNKHRVTPFASAGVGGYFLFNYTSSMEEEKANLGGFVAPVGVGVKYKMNSRIKLLLDGNVRVFTKNLDNRTGEGINNPNTYYTIGLGMIYEITPNSRLW